MSFAAALAAALAYGNLWKSLPNLHYVIKPFPVFLFLQNHCHPIVVSFMDKGNRLF